MWDRITLFYSGLCIPSTKPCGKLLRSLEIFENPHKPHKLRASVFPLMSLRLTCMSWMRHISITFLMCQMSYFIISTSAGVCAVLSKIKKIFCCSFHSVRKMHALPNFTSVLHFIYRLSYKRGKKIESRLWVQFWVESKLVLSSWLFKKNQLTSCLFLNAWVISNLAGSERKLFLSYGSWEAGMEWASDLSPTYYGDTEVLYGHIDWLCCLSEGSFWMAVLPFVPKGYSIPVACNVWGE